MARELITLVDYRAGNLASVQKGLAALGFESHITDDPEVVRKATRIVLPGVGHFSATQRIEDSGVKEALQEAIGRGVPFLGICVGMQWLYEGSTEAPEVKGLGIFKGNVERFAESADYKVPHVGWNNITPRVNSRLLKDVPEFGFVYYTHSYKAPVVEGVVATTTYGDEFAAAVEKDNVFGVQFHPEKSSTVGMTILKNFCEVRG